MFHRVCGKEMTVEVYDAEILQTAARLGWAINLTVFFCMTVES